MHISSLQIRNFRNFRNVKFSFTTGVNTFIGENGVGKTNAFHALRLLLDEGLPRNAISLRETDFCRAGGAWQGHWIIISIDFGDLDPSEGCQILKHLAGHMNGSQRGTHTLFFRPNTEARKELHELSKTNGAEAIKSLTKLTLDDYEAVLTGRATADFNDDAVYQAIAGNFAAGSFPDPHDDDQHLLGVRTNPIHQEVACTFIKALRDVLAELQSYRGNPLLNLLRGLEAEITIGDAKKITDMVEQLNTNIASLDEIKTLSTGIQGALLKAVGNTYSPEITIESTLPDSMEKLLQRLGILVGEAADPDYRGDLSEQSLGSANLIYLALKFLEYQRKLSTDRVAHFLLIEEPEAHLHAHVQKTLFTNLDSEKTQVIVSTHSTQISSISRIKSVNVLAKAGADCAVYQPAQGLDDDTINRIERYLDAVRSTLLFAKGVILVEGEAELIMIPAMVRAVFGVGIDELGLSVIAMNASFFEHIAVIFSDDRIRRRCAILSDLDKAFIPLPDSPESDDKIQMHARASQLAGVRRQTALNEFTANNPWLSVFLAEHTFEVDFVLAGNAWETIQTLEDIYTREADRTAASERLNGERKIAATEVLRLAAKEGKGWFALLLAEKLFTRTVIPTYILSALAFACQDILTDRTFRQIGLYRIREVDFEEVIPDAIRQRIDELISLPTSEFVTFYLANLPDDPLSTLYREISYCQLL